jgi:pimeloyl-ACP methyl ester carboxylesterase
VLFIHGAFAGGWMWTDTFMPFLAKAGLSLLRAVACVVMAAVRARAHIDWHSIADYVEDIRPSSTGWSESPILVGHSMGGFVIQKYLEHHEARRCRAALFRAAAGLDRLAVSPDVPEAAVVHGNQPDHGRRQRNFFSVKIFRRVHRDGNLSLSG